MFHHHQWSVRLGCLLSVAHSSEQMCDLMDGKYDDVVENFTVIDARYPYEYKGGHIKVCVCVCVCVHVCVVCACVCVCVI